ncbi:MAG: hypothetical protein KH033_01235 [Clostridiales bacterium]|nr:hypothetical protein [Clostridiales bacterium]
MKFSKKLCAISLSAVMSLSVCIPVFAADETPEYETAKIQVNGVMAKDPAVLADGATYVKAENIKSLFGVECSVKDGKATLTVDGKQVALDSAVVDENLISIRTVADTLDLMLGWDDAEKTAIVIDVNNVAKENDVTFDLLKKYMDYSKSMGDTFKTTGEFKGSVEVADETAPLTIAYDGTVDSLASKKGEEATMKLNMDLSKVKTMLQSEEMDESEKAVMDTIFKAIESSETKYIYDMEKGIFYMNSSMFSAFGVDPAAWISLDLNAFMNMSGAGSFDMNAILDLAETGDIEGYILEVLKSIPVDSVNSYKEIDESYKAVAAMLSDKAFKQDGDKYTSTYALNEDGTELTYVTTLGSEGDKVNSISIVMKMSADGVKMDMTVSTDKDFNSSMSFTMDIADFMKLYMEFKSTYEASAKEPALTLPEGAVVISLNDMMNNLATDVVVTETAVEATEVSKNAAEEPTVEITEIETPVENTEVA